MFEVYSKAGFAIGSALGEVVAQRANHIQSALVMSGLDKQLKSIETKIAVEEGDLEDRQARLAAGDTEVSSEALFRDIMLSRSNKGRGYDAGAALIAETIAKHPENPILANVLGIRMQDYLKRQQNTAEENARLEAYLVNQMDHQRKVEGEKVEHENKMTEIAESAKLDKANREFSAGRDDTRSLEENRRADARFSSEQERMDSREARALSRDEMLEKRRIAEDESDERTATERFNAERTAATAKMTLEKRDSISAEVSERLLELPNTRRDGTPLTTQDIIDRRAEIRRQVEEEYDGVEDREEDPKAQEPEPPPKSEDDQISEKRKELDEALARQPRLVKQSEKFQSRVGGKNNPTADSTVHAALRKEYQENKTRIELLQRELRDAESKRDINKAIKESGGTSK
jgi:hypothetical protein